MSWEYEGLFNTAGQDGATEIRVGAMGYRTRTAKAGPRLEAEVYPIFGREQGRQARAARKKETPEKQRKLNQKRRERYFILLLEGNFTAADLHVTLTYQQAAEEEQARRDLRGLLCKLRRRREKAGLSELKYLGVIESGGARTHIHLVVNGGIGREEIEALWGNGYANADRLQPDERGLEALGKYLMKQRRGQGWEKGKRAWVASRNLKKPRITTSDSKVSRGRVKKLALQMENEAQSVMEKIYPGYRFVACQVYWSDVIDGVYIRCVMRRKDGKEGNEKRRA